MTSFPNIESFANEFESIVKLSSVMKDVGAPIQYTAPSSNEAPEGPSLKARLGTAAAMSVLPAGFIAHDAYKRGAGAVRSDLAGLANAAKTPVSSFKSGLSSTFSRKSPGTSALNAASVVLGAPEAFAKEDILGLGRSRLQRMTGYVGEQAGNIIGSRFGVAGNMIGGMGGRAIGSAVGSVADKVRGYKPKQVTK